MNGKELKDLIKKGESQKLEFKSKADEGAGKSICSLANTNNGIILIGVDDDGKIDGVHKKKEQDIANMAHSCKPSVYPKVIPVEIEGKNVFVVKVKKSNSLHSFKNICYKRIASHDKPLSPEEVIGFAKDTGKIRFDLQVCEGARLKNIDWSFVESFFINKYETINKTKINSTSKNLLENLGCIKNNKPTNAGILLFGKKPQRFFMNSYIAIARYRKNVVGSERLDYKEFDGNIFSQIDKAVKYIINNTAVMSRLIPGRVEREDIPEYPLFSIREIITNAITHRDYRQESKVIIKIFSNRIEVYNPGGLLAGITPKNIVNKQYSRNPVLARVLNKVRYIEELGEGWDKIIEEHKKHHLRPKIPSIKDVGKAVIVNMFSVKDKFVETKIEQYDLNERQRFVLDYLKSKIFIRSIDIQKEFDVTRDTANRDINGLIKLTLIRREGIGKSTRYKLK